MPSQPSKQPAINKRNILVFTIGLLALGLLVGVGVVMFVPSLATRLDNLAYRARSQYRQMFPPPKYLPTPAPLGQAVSQSTDNALPVAITLSLASPTATAFPLRVEIIDTPTPTATVSISSMTALLPAVLPTTLPSIVLQPPASTVHLTDFDHDYQTWNNCGPATISTYLSYYGASAGQAEAAAFLKPNRDDKNVSPHEMVTYVEQQGLQSLLRQGGTVEQLKLFLSNGFPVVVQTWFDHDGDEMGHYRLVKGYDDTHFITSDSYNGPSVSVDYNQFERLWRVFNYPYLVAYTPEQADKIARIIGPALDDTMMYEQLLAQAEAELTINGTDKIAYFNQGEALTRLNRPHEAVVAFDQARQLNLHWRRLWYQFSPFEAYYMVGRYQDVIDLAQATINSAGGLEEAYYYLGLALHATEQAGAADSFQAALDYNPNFQPAQDALAALE